MNTKVKIHIPSICLVFVVLYLYWALWKEFSPTELLYNAGMFLLFAIGFLNLLKEKWKIELWQEVIFLSFWCVCMFWSYNNSDYSFVQRTVYFFGMRMDSHARIIVYFFLSIVPGVIIATCYKYKDTKLFKILIALIIGTSLYFSIRAVIVFPDALRARSSAEQFGFEEFLYGTPTYSIVYSMCLLAPWFASRFSNSKGSGRTFYGLMFSGICIIVAISQFATALLALLLGIISYWLLSSNKAGGYIFRFIMVIIMILVFFIRSPMVGFLNSISEVVSGAWAEKLKDIAIFLAGEGAGGDIATRSNLYSDSWSAFSQSPIFGKLLGAETGDVGGHSTALDILALVGVFGGVFFAAVIYIAYKRMRASVDTRQDIAATTSVMISYLFLLCTKNITTALCVNYSFFVVLPILFNIREHGDEQT